MSDFKDEKLLGYPQQVGKERTVQEKEARIRYSGPAEGNKQVPRGRLPQVEGRYNLLSPDRRPPTQGLA